MKSFVVLGLAAAAMAFPQTGAPAGCSPSAPGTFQITTVNATTSKKRDLESRQLSGPLTLTLQNGILKDQAGRQGYIASNNQFQFDSPIQAGALVTSGFSLCSNQSLALGGSALWYQCLSGNFYNLYNKSIRQDCIAINIQAVNGGTAATQISDGQPQATSRPAVTQISDGQPQASRPASRPVVSQISDGQPQASRPAVVSQISDGQPQASRPAVVSQISDGQPQASRPAVVTQISDGQPQASPPASRPVVTQISDGQPQASAPASRPVVTQISDGQPQASAPASRPVVTQISDGQPQASAPAPLPTFTGAATAGNANSGALFAGLLGLLALL